MTAFWGFLIPPRLCNATENSIVNCYFLLPPPLFLLLKPITQCQLCCLFNKQNPTTLGRPSESSEHKPPRKPRLSLMTSWQTKLDAFRGQGVGFHVSHPSNPFRAPGLTINLVLKHRARQTQEGAGRK